MGSEQAGTSPEDRRSGRRGSVRRTGAYLTICGTAAAMAALPGGAVAPDRASAARLFTFVEPREEPLHDVAVAPDGAFLYIEGKDVFRVGADGRRSRLARLAQRGGGLSVAADGGVLVSVIGAVVRVAPNGSVSTVAGGGSSESTEGIGDGGPATQASVGPSGVAATPDGGFLIADQMHHLVRKVAPDGTITTVAGKLDRGASGSGESRGGFGGDGGPATRGRLNYPSDIEPLADGGFLIADFENDRVRRVLPDGTITTVAGNGRRRSSGDGGPAVAANLQVEAVDAMPNGGFVVAGGDRVRTVTSDGRIKTIAGGGPVQAPESSSDARSVAGFFNGDGRQAGTLKLGFGINGVASDPFGGLLFSSSGGGLRYLANPPSRRMGVAIRATSTTRRTARISYLALAPGDVTLELRRTGSGRRVAVAHRRARAGLNKARLPRVRPGSYSVTVHARAASGHSDSDRIGLILGGRLPKGVAAEVGRVWNCNDCAGGGDGGQWVGQCRRFSRRRVDCQIAPLEFTDCNEAVSVVLRRSGLVFSRTYGCPIRRHPRRKTPLKPAPLL